MGMNRFLSSAGASCAITYNLARSHAEIVILNASIDPGDSDISSPGKNPCGEPTCTIKVPCHFRAPVPVRAVDDA